MMKGGTDWFYFNLKRVLLLLAFLYIAGTFSTWLSIQLTNHVTYGTINDIRSQLIKKVNTLPIKFFDQNSHGDIINRFTNDMDSISDGLLQGLTTLLTGILTILGALFLMIFLSPQMTLIVLFCTPFTFLMGQYIAKNSFRMYQDQAKHLGALNGYITEMIHGQKTVRAFHHEEQAINRFSYLNQNLHVAGVNAQFYGSLVNPTTRLVNNITYSLVGAIGCLFALSGTVSIGEISSFLIYANLFAKPFNEMAGVLTQMQSASASAQRVFQIMDTVSETPDSKDAITLHSSSGDVTLEHVSFSYSPDTSLLSDINLHINSGSKVAIVGHTGSGKTTLVNLLLRFYDVNQGTILLDHIPLTSITRDCLRNNFGMVLQDTYLFNGSIRENIAFGRPDASLSDVTAAAKSASIHEFILSLPNGYDTIITNSGDNLSLGQRQLLTIARVMLLDPPILILDEATSNIDTRTEISIQKAFQQMLKGRTSFIIAHRLKTIQDADLILVMDHGNIVEQGTHDQLMKLHGHYESLYQNQFATTH
jgi:ATP-binding cassette, subfamily B, multidrug efflux pump